MSNNNHTAAWKANIRAKALEIQALLNEVFSLLPMSADPSTKSQFQDRLALTTEKCKAMHFLYGPNLVPPILLELTQQLDQWKHNLPSASITRRIAELHNPIGQLSGDDDDETLSFTSILERHRDDQTLQDCLSELIAALETLIADGDDTLTKQASDELERILRELNKRKGQSLPDLMPWIEFALVSTGAIFDFCTGTPLATIAATAVIAAKNSHVRTVELFLIAQKEYLDSLKLKGREKFDGVFGRKLLAASGDDLKKALAEPEGLKNLPAPPEMLNLPAPQLPDSNERP